jgi:twitching motility protein PilT
MAKIDSFFKYLKEKEGSDLHMTVGSFPIIRVAGSLVNIQWQELTPEINKQLLYEIMTELQQKEFEETHDVDFAYEVDGLGARFRANVFMDRKGIGGVFRIIPTEIKSAQQLGLPENILKLTEYMSGLVLVTGATGSGKSTTLAAMIDHINHTRTDHVITIEDPIEFVHQSDKCLFNQREVGLHTGSFASALRAALREDPDIILVGEMRDLETIELALTAAETGHLVFGTLHTSSAAKTVDRIINVFPPHEQEQVKTTLGEALRGVIAQQLCKTADGKGRAAALEILVVNQAVGNLIREGKTYQIPSIIQTGKKDGMQLMDQALLDLMKSKRITPEEAYTRSLDKKAFAGFLPQKGNKQPVNLGNM